MPKRKRTAIAAALPENITPLAQDASTDDNYDNSSGLSSPPPSSPEEVDDESYSPIEPREVIPASTKKKAKKMTRANKKVNTKDEDEEDEDGEYVKTTKKTRAPAAKRTKGNKVSKKKSTGEEGEEDDDGERMDGELPEERPPPVNSDYVPIPWKGRLGFACLNTYLRSTNPPIFCSRTCRIDTILKHGKDGQKFVQSLGLANAQDLIKLIHWNEKYGIKFLRISSEMFPFASHSVYGYSLDFAKDVLAEAGKVAMMYGHRLTMHPGQFTQFGSPRKEVVESSIRDVDYHCQLLGYLGLKGQADRDAVMILHMGGTFGDKSATLQRFRENYATLSPQVKARLVLENDDMCWSVHDLLPICKELNIPLVLDWHHHNIIRDPSMREGTLDILKLIPEIKETWTRKGITQKQHYSEPRQGSITNKERRRHSARVGTLPPCEDTMDLMIEAKDKEQAVFELMRKFKLPGWEKIADVVPHVRSDENKPEPKKRVAQPKRAKKTRKKKKVTEEDEAEEVENAEDFIPEKEEKPKVQLIPDHEVGMGGPEGRVYWPEGKEEWLSPPKKIRVKKEEADGGVVVASVDHKEGKEELEVKPKEKSVATKKKKKTPPPTENDTELSPPSSPPPAKKSRAKRTTKKAASSSSSSILPLPPAPQSQPLAVVAQGETEVDDKDDDLVVGEGRSQTIKRTTRRSKRVVARNLKTAMPLEYGEETGRAVGVGVM